MKHPDKLIGLDVLRGMACLLVWVSHIRVATEYFNDARFDFIQAFTAWGRESVVIFFMLSGIVINLSSQNKTSRWQYFKKRFIRIYPVYLAVLIICFTADHFIFGNPINTKVFTGNLFISGTLPAYLSPVMPLNPAVWSITCEVFFYIVFGLIFKPERLKWVWIWLGVCGLSILYKVIYDQYHTGLFYHIIYLLNSSFLWIAGYLVFEYRNKLSAGLPAVICGILMVPLVTRLHHLSGNLPEFMYYLAGIYLIPLFAYLLKGYRPDPLQQKFRIRPTYFFPFYLISIWLLWRYSGSLMSNKIFYSCIPFLSLMFYLKPPVNALKWLYEKVATAFSLLAGISYPLYLLHMPVMYLAFHFLPGYKVLGMVVAITVTLSVSYFFEIYLFKRLAFQQGRLTERTGHSNTIAHHKL